MFDANLPTARPTLLNGPSLAATLEGLRPRARSVAEMWRLLTETYVVDLDAVASLLPTEEPETVWLTARD